MTPIQIALSSLANYRNALLEELDEDLIMSKKVRARKDNFLQSLGSEAVSSLEGGFSRTRLKCIENLLDELNTSLSRLITFAARESSGCESFDADTKVWIEQHAPLLSRSAQISAATRLIDRSISLNETDFKEARGLLADFDFEALLQPILNTYTPDIAINTVRSEAAGVLVDFFKFDRYELAELTKEHKAGYILSINIWSSVNEYNFRSEKNREWRGIASQLHMLQQALRHVEPWAGDSVFVAMSGVFGQLKGNSHYDVYYSSRDKFKSGQCQLTMFNNKLELLIPKSALGQLIGFVRTYAPGKLLRQKHVA